MMFYFKSARNSKTAFYLCRIAHSAGLILFWRITPSYSTTLETLSTGAESFISCGCHVVVRSESSTLYNREFKLGKHLSSFSLGRQENIQKLSVPRTIFLSNLLKKWFVTKQLDCRTNFAKIHDSSLVLCGGTSQDTDWPEDDLILVNRVVFFYWITIKWTFFFSEHSCLCTTTLTPLYQPWS